MKLKHSKTNLAALFSIVTGVGLVTAITLNTPQVEADDLIQVYKSPTCGCCSKWIAHIEEAGFAVEATNMDNVNPFKQKVGVPQKLASCHTAMVDGYFIEGHVPADDIKRLLKERPDIAGLTAPGMPIGSPGMEVPGRKADNFQVLAVGKDGQSRIFASH